MRERTPSRAAFIAEKKLNHREVQTLELLAVFLQNKEIADRLGVSIPVTEKILRNVFRKLGVRTRAEAVAIWNAARTA
ncbi:MAG: helix-turn-helix transcriptional regulator [Verrucomicrobiales bacterium]|nr:helix-turn-helix transcriptional regulator [Verrucomicrobiales bacterium]